MENMLDFVKISDKVNKQGVMEIIPSFKVIRSKDLMIRGNSFYSIWDDELQKWSTDEFDAIRLIDQMTIAYANEHYGDRAVPQLLVNADNCLIDKWKKYCQKQAINNYTSLDETLIFSNMERKRENYSSRQLKYPLEKGDHHAWDRLLSVLYDPKEAHKIEWSIGAIVSGDSKWIEKFLVFYGSAGTGKSTILNIVQMLFEGYYAVFDAKALGSNNNSFALESFRSNPLVAIQHDGDLSRIEDNTKLNSLVSHEEMTINEKFKSSYTNSFKAFLMMGTNKHVKITDAKSGLIRRLIDVSPTGNKIPVDEYRSLMAMIPFQLSGIAHHCLEVYLDDPKYYSDYVPTDMLVSSNDFYNFISDNYMTFSEAKDVPLSLGWEIYKNYCEESNMPYPLSKRAFREEFRNYFYDFKDRHTLPDGKRARSYYIGFLEDKFNGEKEPVKEIKIEKNKEKTWLDMEEISSVFDKIASDYPAQLTTKDGIPLYKWDSVKTKLSDIDTKELHYVKVPVNHIVIDFDIPDQNGNKSLELNLEAASKWPETYAELSKSGKGIHLHYIYSGDADMLSRVYDEHIEIKVYVGNSSLRRKLTKCNELDIATISSGLPLKEERRRMVDKDIIKNEKMLRLMIIRNLRKEYHDATKPSIDFINKLLNDAYNSGIKYDVSDLRFSIMSFAACSTNQSDYCLKIVNEMPYHSEETSEAVDANNNAIVFFDVEVFPNLFIMNWKFRGKDKKVVRMINPSPVEVERMCNFRLVGYNNRRYDNHILYARIMGYSVEDLFELSQRIINGSPNAMFREAYNLSYTDVYDFASAGNKQSLKKWEIQLGIKHHELGLPWDKPVPKELWPKVAEYCDDDVIATEVVFDELEQDWETRQMLASIANKTPNDSTNSLTTSIVFGNDRKPQNNFNYRDLSKPVKLEDIDEDTLTFIMNETSLNLDFEAWDGTKSVLPYFPGYEFKNGKSTYRGLDVGEGGYVEAEVGYHENVALLDVSSMHPHSAIDECLLGPKYTKRYKDLVDGRIAIKHRDFETARSILDGKIAPFVIDDDVKLAILATALKTPINAAYGLTSASFSNPWRDPRNVDNIVAKRGALFMIDLKYEVEARGFTVAHIKTDSIKIPNANKEIIKFVMEFGKKYGYEFEHEATYRKMCLVNDAVYIAKYCTPDECMDLYGFIPEKNSKADKKNKYWTATGPQFAVPYVFKTLFSKEPITIEDMYEVRSVKSSMYLDFNESKHDVGDYELLRMWRNNPTSNKWTKKELRTINELNHLTDEELDEFIARGHDRKFIGKVGAFCPVKAGCGGGLLVRENVDKNGFIKYDAVAGSKGYRWAEYYPLKELNKADVIDKSYYTSLVDGAMESIGKYTDAEAFVD